MADRIESEYLEHYESNLERQKDERDAIQKKTFTKWVNKHLSTMDCQVKDLFVDLSDGYNLITLLEALTDDHLPRETGFTRFHRIQNVHYCLDYLRKRNIRTVNIRPEDIVEGNPKLTLGLIWTIILGFQVSIIHQRKQEPNGHSVSETVTSQDGVSAKDALLQWAQNVTRGYPGVNIRNFTNSWRDGLAFNAILHRYRPNLISWSRISDSSVSARERLENAFAAAESEFSVSRLLDAEDVDVENPDEKSIITYVSSLYNALPHSAIHNSGAMADIVSRLTRGIGITNEKLDLLLSRIENVESRLEASPAAEIQRDVDSIAEDLSLLESPILGFFDDVDQLRQNNHQEANDFYRQVYGLEQRRTAYLNRLRAQLLTRLGVRSEMIRKETEERSKSMKRSIFGRVEECIEWIRIRLEKLTEMDFVEDLEVLEEMFEHHKVDNRDIQDFRQDVDECIARQAEVSTEDTHEYCELLSTLESEYQQLRDLSAGRMLDLDSLIAFVRAAQHELVWINEREDVEVTRNWSSVEQLDLPMLQNYYKQLMHEIELREPQFNEVHNKGAALLNQGHPAVSVIEVYLNTMQKQWDWLLSLSSCLDQHLRDALSLKSFMEETAAAEEWMMKQTELLERKYNHSDFSVEEGEKYIHELDEINDMLKKYESVLMSLTERAAQISPLWQRGERILRPIPVTAIADYTIGNVNVRTGDQCVLLDNSDLIHWIVRTPDGAEATVPSVVFRILPPDSRLTSFLARLHGNLENLRKLWEKKHRMVRMNMILNTMAEIRAWDLDAFKAVEPNQREAIITALNDDAHKLLNELDLNDPLGLRLQEELRLTNEHFYNLLNELSKPKEPETGSHFNAKIDELLNKLDEAWRTINDRATQAVPRTSEELGKLIVEHKNFEDDLQALDSDVSDVKELFRQLTNPTPAQRANHQHLCGRWEDLWELCRMYVERLKTLENVINGITEVADIVRQHEITLNSFDDLPCSLDSLRGVLAQLLEINMVLQQQQSIVDGLNRNIALLRQHIARTRQTISHADIDRLEDTVQQLTVRWENVCSQVAERLKMTESALQTQMAYRPEYENEIAWLTRVEATINSLRKPEEMKPEQYQHQLDLLVSEYSQLQERTEAIENVNREGGKFIREAKSYDNRLLQYFDNVLQIHGSSIRPEFRRSEPQPKNGAQIVTEELELLNRRFAQLSSMILERRNIMQVLIQNWKRKKQEELLSECIERQSLINSILEDLGSKSAEPPENAFFISSSRDAASARETMLKISEELCSWKEKIDKNVSEADRLCEEGVETLTPDQFHSLKQHRSQLMTMYQTTMNRVGNLTDSLAEMEENLLDFDDEARLIEIWIGEKSRDISILKAESGDPSRVSESRRRVKSFLDEVSSYENRLKELASLSTRTRITFDRYDEQIQKMYPGCQIRVMNDHKMSETLSKIQSDYESLVHSCQDISSFISRLDSLNTVHKHNVNEATRLLNNLEECCSQCEASARTTAADVDEIQRILNEFQSLQVNSIEGTAKIDEMTQSGVDLVDAVLGTDAYNRINHETQVQYEDIERWQEKIKRRIEDNINDLRSKLVQVEGVHEGINSLLSFVKEQEMKVSEPRDLPMSVSKLAEMCREGELAQSNFSSRRKILEDLKKEVTRMDASSPSPVTKQLMSQLQIVEESFSRLSVTLETLNQNTTTLHEELIKVSEAEKAINQKLKDLEERASGASPADVEYIQVLQKEVISVIERDLKPLQDDAKSVMSIPNVSERESLAKRIEKMSESLQTMRSNFEQLYSEGSILAERRRLHEDLCNRFCAWLADFESTLNGLPRVSLDPVELNQQQSECSKLRLDHQSRKAQLDELIDVSTELRDDNAQMTLTMIQQRYDVAGMKVNERGEKISSNIDKFSQWDLARADLNEWILNERKRITNEYSISLTQEELRNNQKTVNLVLKARLKEKHGNLDDLILKAGALTSDHTVVGVSKIEEGQRNLEENWRQLNEQIDCIGAAVELCKEFVNGYEHVEKWLQQKERMIAVIGPFNIDPKVISSQLSQIELLQNEMEDQRFVRDKVDFLAGELISRLPSERDIRAVTDKMDTLKQKWCQIEEKLQTKRESLTEAKEYGTQYGQLQREIKSSLMDLADSLDRASRSSVSDPQGLDNHLRQLETLEELSANIAPLLKDLSVLAEVICDKLDDPSLKSDVREQLNVTSQSAQETMKKIASMKNAALRAKDEKGQAEKEFEDMSQWLNKVVAKLNDIGPIVAEHGILVKQFETVDQIYKDVLDREGDLTMTRMKMEELMRRSSSKELAEKLDLFSSKATHLIVSVKSKRASLEQMIQVVVQIEKTLSTVREMSQMQRDTLSSFCDSALVDQSVVRALEQNIEKGNVELDGLESLVKKLESIVSGPETNRLKRAVESEVNDWKNLAKEVRSLLGKCQQKKELRIRFENYKQDARRMLDTFRTDHFIPPGVQTIDEDLKCKPQFNREMLKSALSEFERMWARNIHDLYGAAADLKIASNPSESDAIDSEVSSLEAESQKLVEKTRITLSSLETTEKEVDSVRKRISELSNEIEMALSVPTPKIGRDLSELVIQEEDCSKSLDDLKNKSDRIDSLEHTLSELSDMNVANSAVMSPLEQQLRQMRRNVGRRTELLCGQRKMIRATRCAVEDVLREFDVLKVSLTAALEKNVLLDHVKSDISDLRVQHEELRTFKDECCLLEKRLDDSFKACQKLIMSAEQGVNTSFLEAEKDQVSHMWDQVNKAVLDRDSSICSAMQELGSYADTHKALLIWLQDTEESLANQRAPAIELNVVKEQVRANGFIVKHIEEKLGSVDAFKAMIGKLESVTSDESQKESLRESASTVGERYAALLEKANDRGAKLHKALILCDEWIQVTTPLKAWLNSIEKSLQELGRIPTDEVKLQQQINLHKALEDDMNGKKCEFEKLGELYSRLAELTSVEEAAELDGIHRVLVSRFENVGSRLGDCGVLLQQMAEEIGTFLEHTNKLSDWLDSIEEDVFKIDGVSIYPNDLIEQSTLLTELAMAVTEHEALVSTVVEDGRELCRQTTGDEAIALQSRIEALRVRYTQLASVTDSKIAVLSEALPLSEQFHEGCDTVHQWMDAVEQDMHEIDQVPLEAQTALIAQMEDDLEKWRVDVNEINSVSKHLQQLSSGPRADELETQTRDLNRKFNSLADQIMRKSEKLNAAEKQSRQVLDELDYLDEWFSDARERLVQAAAPAVDPDYVRKQLKNQKQMNEDIAVMKARLRDAIADARKVARAIGDNSGGQDALLTHKIESIRVSAEDTNRIGEERLNELEQALALCQEVEQSFGELHGWLEGVESELDQCPPVSTGHHCDLLVKQQAHNAELLQSIQSQKPLLERFKKNVSGLQELCDAEDGQQLEKIMEALCERFESVRDAVRQRASALEMAIESSSQFTDRLDVILANLEGAAEQIRNSEPVSVDPERLRAQLCDNLALTEEMKLRQGAFELIKKNAKDVVDQIKPNDPAITEINNKIMLLDHLWNEVSQAVASRGQMLEETLKKAERFWAQSEKCHKAVEELHAKIDSIEPATGQPNVIDEQKNILKEINEEIAATKPLINELRVVSRDLCDIVTDEEKAYVEQEIGAVEGEWSSVTGIFARKNADLLDAMERAVEYHGLLDDLLNWLSVTEQNLADLPPISSASLADIRVELSNVDKMRSLLDEKAVEREQLNQLCTSLCSGASSHHSMAIRAPVNDLNARWNRLYSVLNERQQKVERAMLEMGHFSQAYDQLIMWIEKTDQILNEIDPHPKSVKAAEIEVCKHKVVQNDVLVHEASLDALKTAGKRMISTDPHSAVATEPMMETLNTKWHSLVDKLEEIWDQLTDARSTVESLGGEMDRWSLWLHDADADLSHTRPTGGLPETAQTQLNDFFVLKAEIEQNREPFQSHLDTVDHYLEANPGSKESWVAQRSEHLKKKWSQVQEKIADKEQKLRIALSDAEQLHGEIESMCVWLSSVEAQLTQLEPISRIPDPLEKQILSHAEFQQEVSAHRELMIDMHSKGTKLQYYCEKKDAIPIKNLLVSMKHRFDKIVSRSADRSRQLDSAFQEARLFFDAYAELSSWINESDKIMNQQTVEATGDKLREALDRHKEFQRELASRQPMYDTVCKRGRALEEHAPRSEQSSISEKVENLRQIWTHLCNLSVQRQRDIEEALLASGRFDEALSSLRDWLSIQLPSLRSAKDEKLKGDLDTVSQSIELQKGLESELESKRASLKSVQQHAEQMLIGQVGIDAQCIDDVRSKLNQVTADWEEMEMLVKNRAETLKLALMEAESFDEQVHELLNWLPSIESRLQMRGLSGEEEAALLEQMDEVAQIRKELDDRVPQLENALKTGRDIQNACSQAAVQPMKYWLKILQTRWDEVSCAVDSKRESLEKQLNDFHEQEELILRLLEYVSKKNDEIKLASEDALPRDLEAIEKLIDAHDVFEREVRERQPEIDTACRQRKPPTFVNCAVEKGTKKPQSKRVKPVRNPKSDQLSERWKKLWIDSMDYGRKLNEMRDYLVEVKKLESFTFEDWRERYLEWTDAGKARISDLFRRIDKSGLGRVPRTAFIDGIISSKFPTSRLEMEKVADVFDKGDKMIDAKEFMAKLRSDYMKKLPPKPKTDMEKINEEVARQSERCKCVTPYKIQKVGEGHYRFGDTQIKRMVRILRSTVMVRVGGGWAALDEFLHKHDPCRAKGRTNIDIQRGFHDDIHDEVRMETFILSPRVTPSREVTLPSSSTFPSSRYVATPGPITKIREKTERSLPMHSARATTIPFRTSPSNLFDSSRRGSEASTRSNESHIVRPANSGNISRSNSRSELKEGSRPGSRCSVASESSERPTRIPSIRGRKRVGHLP